MHKKDTYVNDNSPEDIRELMKRISRKPIKMNSTGELRKNTVDRVNAVIGAIDRSLLSYVSVGALNEISEKSRNKESGMNLKLSDLDKTQLLDSELRTELRATEMNDLNPGTDLSDIFRESLYGEAQGMVMRNLFTSHFSHHSHKTLIQGYIHYQEGKKGEIKPVAMIYVLGEKEYILLHRGILKYPYRARKLIEELKKEHESLQASINQSEDGII